MCHDFYQMSYLQCQGHSAHIPKIRFMAITPQWQVGSGWYFTQLLFITKGVSWPWAKVISPRSNPCPDLNSSLHNWIWMIFLTLIFHDPRVCHDLEPRSYLQVQGHNAHIPKNHVRAITPHCHVGSWKYITQFYHDLDSGSYCQGQGHCLHITKKLSPDHYFSRVT